MSVLQFERRLWTVAEYYRIAEAGILHPDERLELIDGEIYRKRPQSPAHAMVCDLVAEVLREAFGRGYLVRGQMPLQAGDLSEPEPDVAVARGVRRDYVHHHPTEAPLVVEVSESSVVFDLTSKATVYARSGFAEYWVVVIPERSLVVHREPDTANGEYRSVERYGEHDLVSPLQAPSGQVRVADLLP